MRQQRSSAPGFEVTIGGQKFSQSTGTGVELLIVEDHIDMTDMLTIRMGGTEKQPEWSFKVGDEVTAKVGDGKEVIFKGQLISSEPNYQVEGISTLNLRAMDKMHVLGRGRFTRFFEDMKDSDVVSKIAGEASIPCKVEATTETHPYILQRNESNVAFLKRLAARNNYVLSLDHNGTLEFKKAQFSGQKYQLKMGENLRSFKLSYNTVDQVQKVVVRGWDITKKEAIVGEATVGQIQKIGSGELGASMAGQFGDATAYVTDIPVFSQSGAKAVAEAELNRLARQFARGTASIEGSQEVRAGTMVEVSGLQKGMNGAYFVISTRHIISPQTGYTTEFTFCGTSYGT